MADKVYPKGISFFKPSKNAPDFIIGSLVISPNELFAWLKENPDAITEHEKYGKQVKFTLTDKGVQLDTWKPTASTAQPQQGFANKKDDSNFPF
jgi:hypothetical protein